MTIKNKKTPPKGRNSHAPINTEILVQPVHRGVNDIGSWRSALRLADLGNRNKLYNLYTDLLVDGHLADAISKRIEAITDCDLTFMVGGKPVDQVMNLMDTPEFEDLLEEIMLSRFWGISVVECFFLDEFAFKSIPRKHIRPKIKEITIRESDDHGIYYGNDPDVLQFGKDDDFGIILKAAPYVIYKRGGFGDWAQFVELFGMPQRIGKYSSLDEASRRALIQAFQEAGSAPYLVIPKESDVEQTTFSGSTNGALYGDFRQACNEEILITILGQTMTTQDGSSLAQGKVHLAVQEKKHRADRRYVERMLNKHFVPFLVNHGVVPKRGKFRFSKKAQELSVSDIVQLSEIISIPQKYVHDKYNIPQLEKGDEIARRTSSAPLVETKEENTEPVENMKRDPQATPAKIKNQDRNLFLRLWDFFVKAPAVTDRGDWTGVALKDTTDFNQRLISRIVANNGNGVFDAELFEYLSNDFLKAVRGPFKQILGLADFTYGAPDSAFTTAMELNLFQFSAAKTLAEIQELNQAFRESKDFQQFSEKADRITDTFNRTWQRTEYDTAVLTAESASNYQRLSGKTKLFPYWRYETAGDDQVRPEHAKLSDLILPANDPRWNKIFPPNGWKCRCRVVPLMASEVEDVDFGEMRARCDAYFETAEWKKNKAQGWDTNRGKTAEVFSANQQYIRKFPEKASNLLGELYYNDYGLDSFSKKLGTAIQEAPLFNGDVKAWYKTHQAFEDYKGRKVLLPEDTFTKHTTKKYESVRVPLVDCIADALKNPDEVWINNYQKAFRNFNFIKFYKDKVINVICEVKDGSVYQVNTWFEIEQNPKIKDKTRRSRKIDPRWRYRRGLLIKK